MPSSPVVWERYETDKRRISFLFPKLPVRISRDQICRQRQVDSYFAYADGVVYEVTVVSKSREGIPFGCGNREKFDLDAATRRLAEIRNDKTANIETTGLVDGREVHKFESGIAIRMVVLDMQKDRWVECAIHRRISTKPNEDFLDSLNFGSLSGIKIGDGAVATLGDPNVEDTPDLAKGTEAVATEPVRIIAKPLARYTPVAREQNVRGTVRLKVALHANGSIGSVTPVTKLEYGLTEQATLAAKRVVFLPKRVKGVPVTAVMTFEYAFNIY
jgi:TonB family protein